MENQPQENNNQAPRNSNIWMYIVLAIFALGIIGLSFWLISVKNEVNDLRTEKDVQRWELEKELDSIVIEHVRIKEAYGELSDSLTGMDSLFQANADEIQDLLNYKWEFYQVKKKLDRLQVVAQGYVRRMDSIVVVNETLTIENLEMKEEIKIANRNYNSLEKKTDELEGKVGEASILGTYGLRGLPLHVKGSGKEVGTDKVKRTSRIKICFTLSENTIVEPGKKEIYIRIAQPDKEIMEAGRGDKYTFVHKGETLQYSIKKGVNYDNEAIDMCLSYNIRSSQELAPGMYHVDVFDGDSNIGHTTFTLK